MPFQYLRFRTFVNATESEERVSMAMTKVTGQEEFKRIETQGHHGNPIVILETELRRKRDIREFFSLLDKDDVQRLLDSLEDRVDEDCHFYMRLGKQEAYLGRVTMTVDHDVIQIQGALVSYPKNRDVAVGSMREFLRSMLPSSPEK